LVEVGAERQNMAERASIEELGRAGLRRVRRATYAPGRIRAKSDFNGSAEYWDRRYRLGSDSGAGSYGQTAVRKAAFLNAFVAEHHVQSVIEFGCGDGNQLSLAEYPSYVGLDVSPEAVRACQARFAGDATSQFKVVADYDGEQADLALSLDVIYHLVEDCVFEDYMRLLFGAAERYVIIFSSNTNRRIPVDRAHVRHRRFTDWTARQDSWKLQHGSSSFQIRRCASFFVFERVSSAK
jgi:SAM-dependent methyltransferase